MSDPYLSESFIHVKQYDTGTKRVHQVPVRPQLINLLREDVLQCIDLKINFVVVYVNPDQFRTIL